MTDLAQHCPRNNRRPFAVRFALALVNLNWHFILAVLLVILIWVEIARAIL